MKRLITMLILVAGYAFGETNLPPEQAAAYLGLAPPVIVEFAGLHADGGSLGVTLVDAHTNRFSMFEDRSIASAQVSLSGSPSNTYRRVFVGTNSPYRIQNNTRLTSPQEGTNVTAAVVAICRDWALRTTTPAERSNIMTNSRAGWPEFRTWVVTNSYGRREYHSNRPRGIEAMQIRARQFIVRNWCTEANNHKDDTAK